MNIVDAIASIITDDPNVFIEQTGVPGPVSNSEINAAAREATGATTSASNQVADEMMARKDQEEAASIERAKTIRPMLDKARKQIDSVTGNFDKLSGLTSDSSDTVKQSQQDVQKIADLIDTIGQTAIGSR